MTIIRTTIITAATFFALTAAAVAGTPCADATKEIKNTARADSAQAEYIVDAMNTCTAAAPQCKFASRKQSKKLPGGKKRVFFQVRCYDPNRVKKVSN